MIEYNIYTKIKFGSGDIAIGVSENGKIGFQNIPSDKYKIGEKVKNSSDFFPVVLEFDKVESIDVLISQLEEAKKIIKKVKENKYE